MPVERKQIGLRLTPVLAERVKEAAEAQGRTVNNWIEQTIIQALYPPYTGERISRQEVYDDQWHPDQIARTDPVYVKPNNIGPNRVSNETANHPDPFVAELSPEQVAARAALNLERPVQRDEFGNPVPLPEGMAGLVRAVNVDPEVARQIGANLVHEANKPERKSRFRNPPSKPLDRKTAEPRFKGKQK